MVSLIKNQLLKHLSCYTKNLSPDKINISTFGGEGELSNLQLDEKVLTELLELPAWLRLTSAWCNHVSFRISWTKLKSTPITLRLDEVNITVETCEIQRTPTAVTNVPTSSFSQQGKYSFIHKIIDGITIIVNTVNVNFKSPAFVASVQMSRIRVESKTPKWSLGDLRVTRLKDPSKTLLLIFKELSWQTVRIEASSTKDKSLTPLRLLTNQAHCRITIKKKLSDCSILSSRLVLILDDLLWVLTDSQLKAALHFVDSLASLINASTNVTQKSKAQKKLESLSEYHAQKDQQSQQHQQSGDSASLLSAAQKSFNMFDVRETSYHFFSQRIDLHLCDDDGDGRSCHPDLSDGGALQISLQGFHIDYYPFHLAKSTRNHWPKYRAASILPALWLEQSLKAYTESVLNLSEPNRPPTHAPLERSFVQSPQQPISSSSSAVGGGGGSSTKYTGTTNKNSATNSAYSESSYLSEEKQIKANLAKLMTSCVIMKIEDFTLYRVTTSGTKQMPKELISGDKDRYSFPAEHSTIHAEFTYFYFPGDLMFPLPPNKVFVHINPVQVHFNINSVLWLNSFVLNLHESLNRTNMVESTTTSAHHPTTPTTYPDEPSMTYMDVKLEAIMLRIVFDCDIDAPMQRDRPKSMLVQISRLALTNIRELGASRADLANALQSLQEGNLVFASDFPSKSDDLCVVTDRILSHVSATDVTSPLTSPNKTIPESVSLSNLSNLSRYCLWSEPRDIWCIKIDPLWIDFLGIHSVGPNKSVPFIDAVPITLWVHGGKTEATPYSTNTNLRKTNIQHQSNNQQPPTTFNNTNKMFIDELPELTPLDSNIFSSNSPFDDNYIEKPTITSPSSNTNHDDTTADLHCIAHVSNLVSVQIDHYQLLFLLRLAEEMTELSTFLSLDSDRITQKLGTDKSIVFGCVIPQLELTLVMPSLTPGKESSGCDAESVQPDSASLGDDLNFTTDQTKHVQMMNQYVNMESPLINSNLIDEISNNQQDQSHNQQQLQPAVGQLIDTPTEERKSSLIFGGGGGVVGFSSATQTPTKPMQTPISSSIVGSGGSGVGGGGLSRRNRNSIGEPSFKDFGTSLISMKKGFSNFMSSSIDYALKTTGDEISDTTSIQSDISSDSEKYIMVLADDKNLDCMDVMFKLNPFTADANNQLKATPVEMASEVCEEQQQQQNFKTNMSSPSEPSEANSWRRRDLVSMVTFRLSTVEVIRQNCGRNSAIRLQVSAVSCDECGSIPWDELQNTNTQHSTKNKFASRCRAWNIAPCNPETGPRIQLRLEQSMEPPNNLTRIIDKKSVLDWFVNHVEIRLKNLSLDLSMSTVTGLTDLIEDEIIPKPMPIEILIENLKLHLIEDRPPVNITSPGSVPIDLNLDKIRINRDLTGLFQIQPNLKINDKLLNDETVTTTTSSKTITANATHLPPVSGEYNESSAAVSRKNSILKLERDKELLTLQLLMQQLKFDNDQLKKDLRTRESELFKLKSINECDILKSSLGKAQNEISCLLDEKRSLLDSLRTLQIQLAQSNDNKFKSDGNR